MKRSTENIFLIIICVAAFFAYSNVFKGDFVSDDYQYIHSNPYIKDLSWNGIKAIFSNHYFFNYHPVTTLTWALEYKIWKLNPNPYHVDNLLIHLINILLVFVFFKKLTRNGMIGLFVSSLFALHPMSVEVVAWISQRKDLVYTAFYLASLIAYLKFSDNKKITGYLASIAFFLLSLLSKPMAVTLPVVLILIDYYRSEINVRSLLLKIPFFILSLGFGLLTLKTQSGVRMDDDFTPVFPFFDRLLLVSYGVCMYLFKLFLPVGQVLFHFYPRKENGMLPVLVYLAPVALAAVIFGVWKLKKYRKEVIFGLLLFIATISVVLQFVPAGCAIISERYSYFPYLGIFFILALFYQKLQSGEMKLHVKYKNYATAVLMAFLLFFTGSTFARVQVFSDFSRLMDDLVEKMPDHPFSYYSRSNYVLNFKRDPQMALNDINKAIVLDPTIASSYSNRGYILGIMGDFNGSIADFNKAVSIDSTSAKTYMNRGISRMQTGDFYKAREDFQKSTRLDSTEASSWFYFALSSLKVADTTQSFKSFDKALQINKEYTDAYYQRGLLYYSCKDYQKAVADFSAAIQYRPDYAEAYFNRAVSKFNAGDKTACDDVQAAISMGYKQAEQLLPRCR